VVKTKIPARRERSQTGLFDRVESCWAALKPDIRELVVNLMFLT
jgi:hypothetical protein